MSCSESSGTGAPIVCPDCGYHAGQAHAERLLYVDTLAAHDYERQRANAAVDELRAVSAELSRVKEELAIAQRRAARAVQERDAWIDLSDEVKASLAEITGMAVAL